jgi:hypothetical protein
MAVESKHLLHDLAHPGEAAIGDGDPTEDVVAQLPANDDPTEDVAAEDGQRATPAVQMAAGAYPFEPGATLCGRYRLERVVGRGAFSQVFQALDLDPGAAGSGDARVAIKVPRPEHGGSLAALERLAREYELLHRLVHPGVVRVLDLGTEAGHSFEVMELLEGSSLATRLTPGGGRMPRGEAERGLRACAEALDWVHRQGFVHGDIKPGNIFITTSQQTRLLDFGGMPSAPASADGGRPGESRYATPAYASAQVLSGLPPARADDVYSFACVAFEVLAGTHPFGRASAVEARDRGLRPPSVEGLDAGAAAALQRGLAFERERRPASASDLLDGVFAAGAARPRTDAPPGASSRRPWRGPAALGVLALLVAMLAWNTWSTRVGPSTVTATQDGAAAQRARAARGLAQDGTGPAADSSPAAAASLGDTGMPPTASTPAPVRAQWSIDQDVAFGSGRLVVSRKAISAAIPVRRSGEPTGRLELAWRIVEGSARAGRDFIGSTSGVVVLAEGQRVSTLFVPLASATRASGDATFTVILEQVRGPARIAGAASTEVILRDFDD